jgi:hypothetical protein
MGCGIPIAAYDGHTPCQLLEGGLKKGPLRCHVGPIKGRDGQGWHQRIGVEREIHRNEASRN